MLPRVAAGVHEVDTDRVEAFSDGVMAVVITPRGVRLADPLADNRGIKIGEVPLRALTPFRIPLPGLSAGAT